MVDLKTLSQMDVFPTYWKYPEQGGAFKDKVYQILQNRISKEFDIVVPKRDEHDSICSLLLNRDVIHTFTYNNVSVWDSSIDSMNQVLSSCDAGSVYILCHLIWDGLIDSEGGCMADLEEGAVDIMESIPDYDFEFGDVYIDKDDIVSAGKAFAKMQSGDISGALSNSVVDDFSSAVVDLFDNNITQEQVLENFGVFSDMFNMSENYYCTIHLYTSKEIYAYKQYRDSVPEKIRDTIDELLEVVSCPLSTDSESLINFNLFNDDERQTSLFLLEILESSYDLQKPMDEKDYNGLWKTAFVNLDEKLPKLREKYGQHVLAA